MSSNGEIIRKNGNGEDDAERRELAMSDYQPSEASEQPAANPLLAVHYLLKGRYRLLVPLTILCALAGALPLHHLVHDKYSSTGTLRVQPTLPRVLEETPENGALPMYSGFMDMVATLLTSERVIDKAVADPRWVAIAGPASPETAGAMMSKLRSMHDIGSELVTLTYTDNERNAQRTPIAVRVIFEAYMELYNQNDEQTRSQTIQKLQDLNLQETDELKKLDEVSLGIARKYGSADLEQEVHQKMLDLSNLKDEYTKVELALVAARTGTGTGTGSASSQPTNGQIGPEIWALSDGEMARLLDERRETARDVRDKSMTLGENNPVLLKAQRDLDELDNEINQRSEFLSNAMQRTGAAGVGNAAMLGTGSIQTLTNQKTALDKMMKQTQAELDELGRDNIALKDLSNREADITRRSIETKQRLEQLKLETASGGRIDVISYGDRPSLESSKRNLATAAGAAGGAVFAIGGMILFELVNRRMRGVQDVQTGGDATRRLKVLGAIPMLTDDAPASDQPAVAYAVHKIRANLQIDAARLDRRVLAITSPASGNGKTSVVIALGMSFASSHSRVLLVDADLIGGGLTARLKPRVRRNIIDIIRQNALLTDQQIAQASKLANQNTNQLLQALVDFKFIDRKTLEEAVAIHRESNMGVLEALAGEPLSKCVAQTQWPNLSILPRGDATPAEAVELSPMALRRLLQQARLSFDIVLIDTGPLFGSIEATVAASEADGTILIVSRGESASFVRRAVRDLGTLGAQTIGAIFNRATLRDMTSCGFFSASHQSQTSQSPGFNAHATIGNGGFDDDFDL